ncbi:MAG TPA: hypothetical protein VE685_21060 [Thermoanaerobaculia bacterium]|nr:hypothetical protein [Thermoanaerobaculia bacterium]
MAFHEAQEAHHGERETYHREQRAHHAAEYQAVARHYEAFRAAAAGAAEIAARAVLSPPEEAPPAPLEEEAAPPDGPPPSAKRPLRTHVVAWAVERIPQGEAFGPSRLAEEANRHFSRELAIPADSRLASGVLRRLLVEGEVRIVQKGGSHREALYTRVTPVSE